MNATSQKLAAAALSLFVLAGCATVAASGAQSSGGAKMGYALSGKGSPTVVFEAGLGDGKESWAGILESISSDAQTFAYDRPGYGPALPWNARFDSDRDGKRTGDEIAVHLRNTLQQVGVQPPYILVGHSIGGTYALSFAKRYPGEVAGIVLVDGRVPAFTPACMKSDAGLCKPPKIMTLLMPEHQRVEVLGIEKTEAEAPSASDLTDIPITLISATEPSVGLTRKAQDVWLETQSAFAREAPMGRYVEATGATHYVHKERPDLVISEIKLMLEQVRGGEPAGSNRDNSERSFARDD